MNFIVSTNLYNAGGYLKDTTTMRLKQGLYPQQLSSLGRDEGFGNCNAENNIFYKSPSNINGACNADNMYPIKLPYSTYGLSCYVPDDAPCTLYVRSI